jgi:CIC family chloride channel protein
MIRDLQAALGGAGLAVAFNAPFGGAIFVFEEVSRAFRLRLTVVTLIACISAIAVMRTLLGNQPNFDVVPLPTAPIWELAIFAVFGGFVGAMGVLYNRMTLGCIDLVAGLRRIPAEARAAMIGAIVGLVAWFAPTFVGGGDELCQDVLHGSVTLGGMLVIFAVRWFLGPLSYSAGTPGGLFSPLLLVGALMGAVCAFGWNALVPPSAAIAPAMFAVLGMVAFFTGVVRAPLTGVILIAEMTVQPHIAASMLTVAFGAMLSSSLLRGEPIYDTLRARMLAGPSGDLEHGARGDPETRRSV